MVGSRVSLVRGGMLRGGLIDSGYCCAPSAARACAAAGWLPERAASPAGFCTSISISVGISISIRGSIRISIRICISGSFARPQGRTGTRAGAQECSE